MNSYNIISKKLLLNKNFVCKYRLENDNTICFMFFINSCFFFKLKLSKSMIVKNNSIFFFNDKNFALLSLSFLKNLVLKLKTIYMLQYSFYVKLNVIGLGYKNFVLQNQLYLLVGDCNYIIIDIPNTVKVFCKKKQIYILGVSRDDVLNFTNRIKLVKSVNYYKGKGILEFKNFKFMKLKTGKKQRFM